MVLNCDSCLIFFFQVDLHNLLLILVQNLFELIGVSSLERLHEFRDIKENESFGNSHHFYEIKKPVSPSIQFQDLEWEQRNEIPNKPTHYILFSNF
jgi:hypothetical protein